MPDSRMVVSGFAAGSATGAFVAFLVCLASGEGGFAIAFYVLAIVATLVFGSLRG